MVGTLSQEQSELDALRSEAPIESGPADVSHEPQSAPAPATFKPLFLEVVRGIGTALTARTKCVPLSDAEVDRVASALAGVAACYDLANLDPRTAAWLTLAVVASSVALPRFQAPKIEASKESAADAVAA